MNKLLIFFFLLSIQGFSQNWTVNYEASINTDYLKSIDDSKKSKADLNLLIKDIDKIYLNLSVDSTFSFFSEDKSLINETKKGINLVKVLLAGTFYKNLETNETFKTSRHTPEILIKIESESWNISSESKNILGFKAIKATSNKTIRTNMGIEKTLTSVAWFAPSIPISSGPENYNSLPGLVLEVQTSQGLIIRATSIKNELKQKIVMPDYPVISYENYLLRLKKMRETLRN